METKLLVFAIHARIDGEENARDGGTKDSSHNAEDDARNLFHVGLALGDEDNGKDRSSEKNPSSDEVSDTKERVRIHTDHTALHGGEARNCNEDFSNRGKPAENGPDDARDKDSFFHVLFSFPVTKYTRACSFFKKNPVLMDFFWGRRAKMAFFGTPYAERT